MSMSKEENEENEEETDNSSEGENLPKSDTEKTEDKSDEIKRRDAQIAHWRKKAEVLEGKLEESSPAKKQEDNKTSKEDSDLTKRLDKIEFKNKYNISDTEFQHISLMAKQEGTSLENAFNLAKDYIDFQREKVEKQEKTPEPSTKQSPREKKASEYTPSELKAMSNDDRTKVFEELGLMPKKRKRKI